MYFFILHLSIADILTAFFTILPELIWTFTYPRFYGGNALCKILKFSTTVGPYLSSYTLVMTAFDRYQVRQQTFLTCSAISGAQSASFETNNSIPQLNNASYNKKTSTTFFLRHKWPQTKIYTLHPDSWKKLQVLKRCLEACKVAQKALRWNGFLCTCSACSFLCPFWVASSIKGMLKQTCFDTCDKCFRSFFKCFFQPTLWAKWITSYKGIKNRARETSCDNIVPINW